MSEETGREGIVASSSLAFGHYVDMCSSVDPRPKCYVASPLGFSEAGRYYYREVYLPALARVVAPVDPWSLVAMDKVAVGEERETMLAIGRRNIAAIRECVLLVAYLDGQELDAGTAVEVGFAGGIGLACFGLRTDLRQHGEPGMSVNLQVETLILESGGQISSNLDELVAHLEVAVRPP